MGKVPARSKLELHRTWRGHNRRSFMLDNDFSPAYRIFVKKLIPYIISYLIVATGTVVYARIYRHFASHAPIIVPHDSIAVITNPGLSQAELDAKLQQVGLAEARTQSSKVLPAPSFQYVYHYTYNAVMLSAFAGLVILFRRVFRVEIPSREPVA
jgi:hypothetical protein